MKHDVFLETSNMLREIITGLEPALNGYTEQGVLIEVGDVDYVDANQFSLVMINQILDAFNNRDIKMPTLEMELAKYERIAQIATNVASVIRKELD